MSECSHEYVYGGLVNVFDGKKLLKVFEYWKCRRCGKVRAGYRSPSCTSPTDGLLPEPKGDGRWMILICKQTKNVEAYYVKSGEKIVHTCRNREKELYINDEYKVLSRETEELEGHYGFLLEDISPGVIDISKDPVKIIKST
jgi:hypothetical protein